MLYEELEHFCDKVTDLCFHLGHKLDTVNALSKPPTYQAVHIRDLYFRSWNICYDGIFLARNVLASPYLNSVSLASQVRVDVFDCSCILSFCWNCVKELAQFRDSTFQHHVLVPNRAIVFVALVRNTEYLKLAIFDFMFVCSFQPFFDKFISSIDEAPLTSKARVSQSVCADAPNSPHLGLQNCVVVRCFLCTSDFAVELPHFTNTYGLSFAAEISFRGIYIYLIRARAYHCNSNFGLLEIVTCGVFTTC